MMTTNDMSWNDREDQFRDDELRDERLRNSAGEEDDDLGVDPDEEYVDTDDEEDELLSVEDDDLVADDDELVEDDDDLEPGYTNTLRDDAAFSREYDENEGNGYDEDKDFEAHLAPESVDPDPNEIPGHENEQEGSGYAPQREYNEPQEGNNASYSEQTDVTPPNHREFPVEGPGKADFESRSHGRTTGRMIGHEPGTEGI